MTEQTQKSFTEVITAASPFTVGKRLDTESIHTGDTILSPDALAAFDHPILEASEIELRDYLDTLNGSLDLDSQAKAAIVRQHLAEMALITFAFDQLTGEIDRSGEIRELESTLYGHYSSALYRAALRQKIEILQATPVAPDIEMAKAGLLDELEQYATLGDGSPEAIELERPSEETLTAIGNWLHDQFGDVFDEIDALKSDKLDAHQVQKIFNQAVMTTEVLRENNWTVDVVQRNKNAISVFASARQVVISEQRQVTKLEAKKLVVHEIFGHALRSAMAENAGNEVGIAGTASYAEFEESFEVALEQCLSGSYDPKRGIDHYVTIGLAETTGLSRDKVAQLVTSMRQISLAKDGLDETAVKKAEKQTVAQIDRTYAGMTDTDDDITHRKDINYLHGLNGAWKLLNVLVEAGEVDVGMRWLLSAKFNPYDQLDRKLVSQSTPMPASLDSLLNENHD